MKYIFLDTNIFIHFKQFDQIAWDKIVNDDYKIIIAPIVLDELDKHKTNSNKKIAKRVKNILPKIEEEQNKTDKKVIILFNIPKEEIFNEYQLSKNQQDHCLLASIIEFGKTNKIEDILLISHDTGPRLRAKNIGINAVDLEEKYLLQEEDSDEEKELKKLRKENSELKNNLPDVILTFDNKEAHKAFDIIPLNKSEDIYCFELLQPIKKEYSPFVLEEITHKNYFDHALNDLIASQRRIMEAIKPSATLEQKQKYNNKLESFYLEYENIFKEKYKWDTILSNAVRLDFDVINKGTAPAEDIDIFLSFPNMVKLLFFENFPKYEKPKSPYKPKYAHDIDMSGSVFSPLNSLPPKEYIRVMDKSCIENTVKYGKVDNSSEVHYKCTESLKHNLKFSLAPIWAISKESFQIDYKILIANYPKPVEGTLNIIINGN
jgi:predicted nucleic acid-binding protein